MLSNVWKLILGNGLGQSWPIRAVIFLYFLENGATEGQYQMVQWLMFWTLLFIEVPTGYLSDRWSRKGVLVTGAVFRLAGITLYAVGQNVWWFLVGEQILAVAKSLHSGTVQSALRESLRSAGKAEEYRKYSSLIDMTGNAFQLVAVFAGGIIGIYSLRATAVISCLMSVCALLCYLTVKDPPPTEQQLEEKARRGPVLGEIPRAFRTIAQSFRTVWRNPVLWCAAACLGLVTAASQHLYALRQPFAVSVGLEKQYFGGLETVALLIMIGGGFLARRAHPRHDRMWLALMGLVLFGGIVFIGSVPSGGSMLMMLVLLAGACLVRGVSTFGRPVVDDIMQKEDIDMQRATVLSIGTFIGYGLVAVTGPVVQWMLETGYSVPAVLATVGLGGGFLYMAVLLTNSWFRRKTALS